MAEYVKRCAWCGREFKATRSDAVYCSANCRVGHWRNSSTKAFVLPPQRPYVPESRALSEGEIVGCIATVRQCAASLSAASLTGPPQYRPVCGRISRGILGVLEVEGL